MRDRLPGDPRIEADEPLRQTFILHARLARSDDVTQFEKVNRGKIESQATNLASSL